MTTDEEDKNNKDYAKGYAAGRSGDVVRDFLEHGWNDDDVTHKGYVAGSDDRSSFGSKSPEDCGTGETHDNSSCCYLTSACLDSMGIPRTALEMKAMKVLTKNYILKSFAGKRGYVTYRKRAPTIVRAINSITDSQETWIRVYEILKEVTSDVISGRYEEGYQKYKSLFFGLEDKFLKTVS